MSSKELAGSIGRRVASELSWITLMKVTEIGFKNAQANHSRIKNGKGIQALRSSALMRGSDALVIASGPSMHRFKDAGAQIKDSGFKGVIIAADSATAWCLRNDIVPDLIVTVDPHPDRIARWFGDTRLTDADVARDDYFERQEMDPNFRDQMRFNRELIDLINSVGPRLKIAVASSSSEAVVQRVHDAGMDVFWWNPMYDDDEKTDGLTRKIYGMNGLPCVNAGGNVGAACWVFAHSVLQKKRVGLIGFDLGYYGDTSYKQTQYYNEIVDLVGIDRLDEVFIWIQNPYLKQDFFTDPAYFAYRNELLEMAAAADCTTHNCTGGGILFGEGIEWTSLTDFLNAPVVGRATSEA